ncbi:hypothetical protein [Bilophila sp.]|uniref:hypothetical protein n=1 Tax=Bilophila sp. TaxID=1929485 RepID=UPI003077697A
MPFLELLALAVTLAIDALAVSIATGITLVKPSFSQLLRMPLAFGLFQAIMSVTGGLGLSVDILSSDGSTELPLPCGLSLV